MLTIESDDENEESEVDDEEEKKEESKDSGVDDQRRKTASQQQTSEANRPSTTRRGKTSIGVQLLDLEGEDSDDASDIEKEMEQRVNPLHLIPQLTMNSRGSKKFDFGLAAKDNDNEWMSLGSDRKIALSDAESGDLDDCQVVNAGGGDNFDYISDGFDAYSMASLPEFTVGVDTSTSKKGGNFCYTPSNKSQLRVKMMSNSFAADDSMSMCSAPKFSPCSSNNSRVSSSEQPQKQTTDKSGAADNGKMPPQLNMKKIAKVDDTFVVAENEFEDDTRSADSFKERILNTNLIIDKTR